MLPYDNHSLDAAIDRMIRVGTVSDEALPALLSSVLGRAVPPTAVSERKERMETARSRLRTLLQDPGITQRTQEWYDARMTMVTASDFAQALGCAKFGTQRDFFVKKCSNEPSTFNASLPPLRWGIMFEPVACSLYSWLNAGILVHDFGLLRHPTVPYLGASPDGITEDGVMVEIKCPWRRKIDGEIPLQYYYQIQGQLAVCGLDDCDYFECEFQAECAESLASFDGPAFERGVFVEVCFAEEMRPAQYSYPPNGIGQDLTELIKWLAAEIALPREKGAEVRPQWWSLVKCATIRVRQDAAFVADMLAQLDTVWTGGVMRYRTDAAAYDAEIKNAVVKKRIPAVPKTITKRAQEKIQDAALMKEYAFVELEDEDV